MRLSLLLICVVVAGMIGVSVFAQSDAEPGPVSDHSDSVYDESFLPIDAEDHHEHVDTHLGEAVKTRISRNFTAEEQKLRQQYLELIEQKSAHMDRSALREAISRAESDIDELKANAKLQEAKQLLLDLVKTHPETSAAQTARAMLQAEPKPPMLVPRGTFTPSGPYPDPDVLPQPYDPGDEVRFNPSREVLPRNVTPERSNTPIDDPGPEFKEIPRRHKKGQSSEPFRSPFDESGPMDG